MNTDIAKLCHEVNKAYCESIGDFSQPIWEDAPTWQKQVARNRVTIHLANHNHVTIRYNYEPLQEERSKDFIFKAICDYFKQEQE